MEKRAALFGGDDVDDVFVQPLLVLGIEFFLEFFVALGFLFCGLFWPEFCSAGADSALEIRPERRPSDAQPKPAAKIANKKHLDATAHN